MGKARAFTALLTAAGITALTVTSAGAAGAVTTGVGSAQGSSSVFSLVLGRSTTGSALLADLIGDLGSASNDPAAGGSAALSRLAGLQTASSLVPALDLQVPPTPVQAQSPNGSPSVSSPAIDLSNVSGVTVPSAVASGTIEPASLTATVDSSGAHSGLSAGVSSIALAGGLIDLGSASTQVTNDAGRSAASSVRSLKAGPLTVLSLGQLLAGLGIPLTALPVTTLAQLLAALHLPLPPIPGAVGTLPSSVGLAGEVGALAQSIGIITTALKVPASPLIARPSMARSHLTVPVSVSTSGTPVLALPTLPQPTGLPAGAVTSGISSSSGALTPSAASSLEAALTPVLSALGLGGVNLASALSTLTSLTNLLDTLQGDLSSVLGQALSALDAAPLLKVSGLDIGLTTKATNAVSTSVAALTGTVGTVSVGNLLSTPAVNLTDTVSQLSSLVGSLDAAIGGVLGKVSPSLANLVQVTVLTPVAGAGVSAAKGYVKAVEGVTALTATITPPADLSSLVSSLTSAVNLPSTAAGILAVAGVPTATVGALTSALSPIATLSATLGQTLGALANGATLNVGTISAASDFAPAPVAGASPTSPSVPGGTGVPTPSKLPFTGGNPMLALVGGGGLAALLIARRLRLARRARLG